MNYLDLCKRLRQEAGMSGAGPSAVTSQTGEMKRVVDWVAAAWNEIQTLRSDWLFLRTPFSVSLNAGAPSVVIASSVASIDRGGIVATDGVSRWPLQYIDPMEFAYTERRNGQQSGKSQYCSMDADGTLRVMPVTNAAITVLGDYYRTPQPLAENTDVPMMPERYHLAVVYLAMTYAGAYDESGNLYQDGMAKYSVMLNDMTRHLLPPLDMAGPLA